MRPSHKRLSRVSQAKKTLGSLILRVSTSFLKSKMMTALCILETPIDIQTTTQDSLLLLNNSLSLLFGGKVLVLMKKLFLEWHEIWLQSQLCLQNESACLVAQDGLLLLFETVLERIILRKAIVFAHDICKIIRKTAAIELQSS